MYHLVNSILWIFKKSLHTFAVGDKRQKKQSLLSFKAICINECSPPPLLLITVLFSTVRKWNIYVHQRMNGKLWERGRQSVAWLSKAYSGDPVEHSTRDGTSDPDS